MSILNGSVASEALIGIPKAYIPHVNLEGYASHFMWKICHPCEERRCLIEKVKLEMEEVYGLLLPTRYKICKLLEDSQKPMYASRIAEELELERKLVSFHLSWLEEHGFVTSEFGLANPAKTAPKAVRYYKPTGKAKELLSRLKEMIRPP